MFWDQTENDTNTAYDIATFPLLGEGQQYIDTQSQSQYRFAS